MTKVAIVRKDNHIVSVECSGHTGYGDKGEDIVCAALSSVIQTALLGLMQVAGIDAEYVRRDEEGYFKVTIPELNDIKRRDADMILDTMLAGVSDLYSSYSDYIELEVR
ncbi:MAG: ribosomal-processing cysteine protease Prp [Christensenellales bacterium]|jgi:uncharacterized protein YsxB (DUF464 family)